MRVMSVAWIYGEEQVIIAPEVNDSEALHTFLCDHDISDYTVTFTNYITDRAAQNAINDARAEVSNLNREVRNLNHKVADLEAANNRLSQKLSQYES